MDITLSINDEDRVFRGEPMKPLLDVLREDFHLTGAKDVCREGFCGACTVQVDGKPAVSCLMPVAQAEGRRVCTVESLASGGQLSPLQQAFEDIDAVQCGMCFPGMLMTLTSFLAACPSPTRDDVETALAGNICRCTGYERIVQATLSLAGAQPRT